MTSGFLLEVFGRLIISIVCIYILKQRMNGFDIWLVSGVLIAYALIPVFDIIRENKLANPSRRRK